MTHTPKKYVMAWKEKSAFFLLPLPHSPFGAVPPWWCCWLGLTESSSFLIPYPTLQSNGNKSCRGFGIGFWLNEANPTEFLATPPNLFLSLLPPTYYVSSISIGGVEKSLGPIYGNAILTPHTNVHFMLCPTHHSHELEKTTTMNNLGIHHKLTPNSPPLSILPGVCSSIAAARCRQQEAGERQEAALGICPTSKHHRQHYHQGTLEFAWGF